MRVCQSVVIIEDHDGCHNWGSHHKHDAIEVSA
jgi:hypothetical protein